MRILINRLIFLTVMLLVVGALVYSTFFKKTEVEADQSSNQSSKADESLAEKPSGVLTETVPVAGATPIKNANDQLVVAPTANPTAAATVNLLIAVYDSSSSVEQHQQHIYEFLKLKGFDSAQAKSQAELIIEQARNSDLEPAVLAGIVYALSKFDPATTQGERHGLLLLSQKQAEQICARESITCEDAEALKRPDYNLLLGILDLKYLSQKFSGDLSLILTAYLLGNTENIEEAARLPELQQVARLVSDTITEIRELKIKIDELEVAIKGKPSITETPKPELPVATNVVDPTQKPIEKKTQETSERDFILLSIDTTNRDIEELEGVIDLTLETAKANAFDPILLSALVYNLSGFNQNLISPDGRVGLMQINPGQGDYMAQLTETEWRPESLKEPKYNLKLATNYLNLLMSIFEDKLGMALIAYHWDVRKLTQIDAKSAEIPVTSSNFSNQVIATYQNWQHEYRMFTIKK